MKAVAVHNTSAARGSTAKKAASPATVANRKGKKKGAKKAKHHGERNTSQTTTPKGIGAGRALTIYQKGMAAGKSQARQMVNTSKGGVKKLGNKKASKRKANGTRGGGLLSWLGVRRLGNPLSFREYGGLLKTAGVGFAGFGLSRIISALLVALGRRVMPTYVTDNVVKWLAPALTLLSAAVGSPWLLGYVGLKGTDEQKLITTGGAIGALGQLIDNYSESDPIQAIADRITNAISTANIPGLSASSTGQAVTQAGLMSGLTHEQAAAVGAAAARMRVANMGGLGNGQASRTSSPASTNRVRSFMSGLPRHRAA